MLSILTSTRADILAGDHSSRYWSDDAGQAVVAETFRAIPATARLTLDASALETAVTWVQSPTATTVDHRRAVSAVFGCTSGADDGFGRPKV